MSPMLHRYRANSETSALLPRNSRDEIVFAASQGLLVNMRTELSSEISCGSLVHDC